MSTPPLTPFADRQALAGPQMELDNARLRDDRSQRESHSMVASVSGSPSPEDLERLLNEELSDTDRTAVEAHVETCADCQQRLPPRRQPPPPHTPAPAA